MRRAVLLLLILAGTPAAGQDPVRAQEAPSGQDPAQIQDAAPSQSPAQAQAGPGAGAQALPVQSFEAQADRFEALSATRFFMQGSVTFKVEDLLIQADRVEYDTASRTGEARGNVLYAQGPLRIASEVVSFDLAAETAELTDATGFLDEGYLFRAKRIMQLDKRRLRFENGFFTACTQPVPYWSFRVSSGLIIRERYVHLYNMRLFAGHVPIFYSPYLVFPIKPDRSTGLLLPQIGFSERLGSSLGNALFVDLARNQDATFFLDAYSQGSVGGGLEYRLLPNARGASVFNGYILSEDGLGPEDQPERRRWNVRYNQRQDFRRGARFLADFNFVSDPDYYLDFSRDPDRGSDPAALSRAEYVLNRGYTSLNLRAERREQFFSGGDVTQLRLPEAEFRMRSRRLGRSPLYLAMESSASLLDRSAPGFPAGAYGRVDVLPTLSLPASPTPWLDLTPTLRVRETFYSKALDPADPTRFGSSLSREFVQFSMQTLGPRMSRIYYDDEGRGRMKATIEPRILYNYQTTPDPAENDLVPTFDEIDLLPGDVNEVVYGVSSRILVRKIVPAQPPPLPLDSVIGGADHQTGPGSRDASVLDGAATRLMVRSAREARGGDWPAGYDPALSTLAAGTAAAGTAEAGVAQAVAAAQAALDAEPPETLSSPVEIASFSIMQRYSLKEALSRDSEFLDLNGDGNRTLEVVDESFFSPVSLSARINPSAGTSIDARVGLDVLEKTVASSSLSAGLHRPGMGFLNATWFFRNALDGQSANASRIRLTGGTSFFRRKISVAASLNYDATLTRLQDQRYRFGYDTQCCGFAFEILDRNFDTTAQQEYRFVVNLRGIGNFLDLQGGGAR